MTLVCADCGKSPGQSVLFRQDQDGLPRCALCYLWRRSPEIAASCLAAGGLVPRSIIEDLGLMTHGGQPRSQALGDTLMPNHRFILHVTGFLQYVTAHIDRIEYYPWPAFDDPVCPDGVLGRAVHENGLRIAQIAFADQDDVEVVATIVHEAAHLAGIYTKGVYFDESFAEEVEARFYEAADAIATLFTGNMR